MSWWYWDEKGDIIILIIEKRKGFTKYLFSYTSSDISPRSKIRAIIEGLYKNKLDLKLYDTVLLFAIGIRIAG
jgi:hypothetical protein